MAVKVLDSHALMTFFNDEAGADEVVKLLLKAETGNPKLLMQTIDPVKQEMIFMKDKPEELSIGSINFHKDYFGEGFNIKVAGETAFSGCVAFGMERWIYALTKVHGTDESKWPKLSQVKL